MSEARANFNLIVENEDDCLIVPYGSTTSYLHNESKHRHYVSNYIGYIHEMSFKLTQNLQFKKRKLRIRG